MGQPGRPLYNKGDWAQPGNWRPIVCATTEVKLVWMLILGRIAPTVFAHVPGSMWGAMAGRSPHEAIFLQDTALDMNPYEMLSPPSMSKARSPPPHTGSSRRYGMPSASHSYPS